MISRLLRRLRQLSVREPPSRRVEFRPGDLLSVVTHGGKFGVMRVLAVDAEDLEGHQMWQEARGGYF